MRASPFFASQRRLWSQAAQLGPTLDLACGRGRHALAAAGLGARVVALDRDRARLHSLTALAREAALPIDTLCCDLEQGRGIPLRDASFGAVLVFRYLHRPLCSEIIRCLRPGGLLLYETFTVHQMEVPYGPANPRFLLDEGELPELFAELEILIHEEIWCRGNHPEALARLAARRPS